MSPRAEQIFVFLSHRYKSPEVNLHFYRIFSKVAGVQFEVDDPKLATSVTHLERRIRACHAFVGIYPFSGAPDAPTARAELIRDSRYFRLEVDLAIRAGKPAIVFVDGRYGSVLDPPAPVTTVRFDAQEIDRRRESPSEGAQLQAFRTFRDEVLAAKTRMQFGAAAASHGNQVGIVVPRADYPSEVTESIEAEIRTRPFEPFLVPWPPVLDLETMGRLDRADWCLVDVGDDAMRTGLPAYLHGRAVPSLRVARSSEGKAAVRCAGETALFGGHEVGYPKDLVRWRAVDDLIVGVRERLARMSAIPRRIVTRHDAEAWFKSAAKRKERVFVSYAGEDRESVKSLLDVLRDRFQEVFDYRDEGKSIAAGRPWRDEVFGKLSASPVGVTLLSPRYFVKENCVEEAHAMLDARTEGKMKLFPVRLTDEPIDFPDWWYKQLQYVRRFKKSDADVVAEIIAQLGPA